METILKSLGITKKNIAQLYILHNSCDVDVYSMELDNGNKYAIKIRKDGASVIHEASIQNQIAEYINTVRLVLLVGPYTEVLQMNYFMLDHGSFERLLETKQSDTLIQQMADAVIDIERQLCKNNIAHKDLHWGNISFEYAYKSLERGYDNTTYTIQLKGAMYTVQASVLDFDTSSFTHCSTPLDLAQLIRTLWWVERGAWVLDKSNIVRMTKILLRKFPIAFPETKQTARRLKTIITRSSKAITELDKYYIKLLRQTI